MSRRAARRPSGDEPFTRRPRLSLTEAEYSAVATAADGCGMSVAAWCAQAALSLVDPRLSAPLGLERHLLAELSQARTQAVKIGTNLNQAVHKLNQTGRPPEDLETAAARATETAVRMLDLAEAASRTFGILA